MPLGGGQAMTTLIYPVSEFSTPSFSAYSTYIKQSALVGYYSYYEKLSAHNGSRNNSEDLSMNTHYYSAGPWNKGKLIGQKKPLKPHEIWTIRYQLKLDKDIRNLALLNLALDSKLRGCDLVKLQARDVCQGRLR